MAAVNLTGIFDWELTSRSASTTTNLDPPITGMASCLTALVSVADAMI